MGHAEQADARQSDVAEDLKIARSANLVKDYEIRPDEENHFCCLLQITLERRILSDSLRNLKISGGFHRLDHGADILVEISSDRLSEGGFARTGFADNENTSVMV